MAADEQNVERLRKALHSVFDDIEVEERVVEGVHIPVATPRMLYRMKKDTIRLQDKADADRLRRRFALEE